MYVCVCMHECIHAHKYIYIYIYIYIYDVIKTSNADLPVKRLTFSHYTYFP